MDFAVGIFFCQPSEAAQERIGRRAEERRGELVAPEFIPVIGYQESDFHRVEMGLPGLKRGCAEESEIGGVSLLSSHPRSRPLFIALTRQSRIYDWF